MMMMIDDDDDDDISIGTIIDNREIISFVALMSNCNILEFTATPK